MPPRPVLPPASGAWREGDPVGSRRFVAVGGLDLELGGRLDEVTVAYEAWGTLAPDASNAVLVLHALTGDSHVAGAAGPGHPTPGWWDGLVGPGAPLDTREWFVVAPNVLGGCQGTTGPASPARDGRPYGSRFPRITVGDQVAVERLLADALGIARWASVIGGSMGGMRALEWAVGSPERVGSALVLAVGPVASADQIATQSVQNLAITSDPRWRGGDYHVADLGDGPTAGLGVARRIAHLTYRSAFELQERFGNDAQDGEDPLLDGRFAVQSYLDHQADKLAHRFDAGSYVALTDAMSTWDLGRGRGGVEAALRSIDVPLIVGGIDSDRLYPIEEQQLIADLAPGCVDGLRTVPSPYGHDGFLVEREQVFALVAETLSLATSAAEQDDVRRCGVG
jgi:homoserine O-acetyltransferase/O-succinyltransferase